MLDKLNAPLIVLDTETTGVQPKRDRIIQIGLIKIHPDGKRTEWKTLIDPEEPIPPESTETHHITDEDVQGAPKFRDVAATLAAGLRGCDYCGFNVWFDLDMLKAEFARVTKKEVLNGRVVDVMDIYRKYHPRSLADCYREYTGREMEGAHEALMDVKATLAALEGQIARHSDLPATVEEFHRLYNETPDPRYVDPEQRLYWRCGEATLNFSDHAGTALKDVDRGFLQWVLKKDFPESFKQIVREALDGKYPRRENVD